MGGFLFTLSSVEKTQPMKKISTWISLERTTNNLESIGQALKNSLLLFPRLRVEAYETLYNILTYIKQHRLAWPNIIGRLIYMSFNLILLKLSGYVSLYINIILIFAYQFWESSISLKYEHSFAFYYLITSFKINIVLNFHIICISFNCIQIWYNTDSSHRRIHKNN